MVDRRLKNSYSLKGRIYFNWSWVVSDNKPPGRHKDKKNVDSSQDSGILLGSRILKGQQRENTEAVPGQTVSRNTQQRPTSLSGWTT